MSQFVRQQQYMIRLQSEKAHMHDFEDEFQIEVMSQFVRHQQQDAIRLQSENVDRNVSRSSILVCPLSMSSPLNFGLRKTERGTVLCMVHL